MGDRVEMGTAMPGTVVRRLPANDLAAVTDVYVEGISSIEYLGEMVRVVFYVEQDNGPHARENLVASRLLFSASAWAKIIEDLRNGCCEAPRALSS